MEWYSKLKDSRHLKWILQHQRLRFWLMLAGVFLSVFAFAEVVDDVFDDPKEGDYESHYFDKSIAQFLSGFRTDPLNQVMTDITALGSVTVILMLALIFISVLASFRDWKGIAFISVVLAGGGLWPLFLKTYFSRVRPDQADWLVKVSDLSFPSGHSFGAAAAYIGLAYYASRYARSWSHELFFFLLGGVLAVLVGVSRIYLGVHFPTDVLAGLAGGVAWGLTSSAIFEFVSKANAEEKRLPTFGSGKPLKLS